MNQFLVLVLALLLTATVAFRVRQDSCTTGTDGVPAINDAGNNSTDTNGEDSNGTALNDAGNNSTDTNGEDSNGTELNDAGNNATEPIPVDTTDPLTCTPKTDTSECASGWTDFDPCQ
jgi:hypothetical protein